MEDHLTKLHRCLFESNTPSSDFLYSLRSDTSVAIALQHFYLILKRGVSVVVEQEDGGDGVEDKKLGFQLWTDSQIQSVVSFGLAIVSASRSLSVSQAEPVVIAVVQQLLEFAVCYLEKSDVRYDESSIQIDLVQLMELALAKEIDEVPDRSCPLSCILELLPVVSIGCCDIQFDSHMKCILQGVSCVRAEKQVDRLLMTLATECLQPEEQTSGFNGPIHATSNLIFASQHWALIHVDCVRRLIPHCRQLIELVDMHGENVAITNFAERLSFSLRILRLLRSLVKENPYVEYDASLLQQVASLADTLPSVFGHRFEFADNQGAVESDFENLVSSLLEEFLHLVQSIFGNSSVSQNIQVCIVASILDNLDSSIWRNEKSAVNRKPPLVYFPRTVFLILRIVQDFRRATSQSHSLKDIDRNLIGSSSDSSNKSPSCHLRQKEVPLTKRLTVEESMRTIFTSSAELLDNLMHLILFLHSEGMKFRPKVEKSQSTTLKANFAVEMENTACHEDDALFGNLFAEGGRSVGSVEVYDQPPVALSSYSNSCNMPMQAASELLGFLKDVMFSQEYPTLYEDGCRMIRENHIDALLSLLNCQECGLEDKSSDGFASLPDEGKTSNIHGLCVELLYSLLTQRTMSASLEEYLVEQILAVEDGAFAYSDRGLMLLAHAVFTRAGLDGGRLRARLYGVFVDFITDKANLVCSNCPSFRELLGALPSVFHMEVLLMAFHLSSTEEKAKHVDLIFSALRAIGGPSDSFSCAQLSCWGLLVSRFILLLRHMVFYPDNCPSSLLVDLRSKLRDVPLCGSLPNGVNDELLSWASIAAKNVLGGFVEEEPAISCLINQLVDISALPPSLCRDKLSITSLSLNCDDLCDTFLQILGYWKGRKTSSVEDLLVERYIFILCSDIPMTKTTPDDKLFPWMEPGAIDMSDIAFLFHFSHAIMGCSLDSGIFDKLQTVVLSALQHISTMNIPEDVDELGWDFLRSSLALSFILSLVNVGLTRHESKRKDIEVGLFLVKDTTYDIQYATVAEQLVSSLIGGNLLVELLTSLLKMYLGAHQKAFLATLNSSQYVAEDLSPLLLLKLSSSEKCLVDDILRRSGISYFSLDSTFNILSKVDSLVNETALGIRSKVFWECALHFSFLIFEL